MRSSSFSNKGPHKLEIATLGSGCFWCTEAIFQSLKGVEKVVSGFAGGTVKNPSYEQIFQENTGHTEVCQITFNSSIISYADLLKVFWKTHDPTTLNRQGNDVGYQYRSVIFYHSEEQKKSATRHKAKLMEENVFDNDIMTAIEPFKNFSPAEDYHQNYYKRNPRKGYCQYVILPKLKQFEKIFCSAIK